MAQVCAGHKCTLIDASKSETKQNRGEMIFGNGKASLKKNENVQHEFVFKLL